MTVIILDFFWWQEKPTFPQYPFTTHRHEIRCATLSPSVASTSRWRNFSPVQPPCSCHWLQDPKMQSLGLGGHQRDLARFRGKIPGKKYEKSNEKSHGQFEAHSKNNPWTTNWTHGLFGGSQKSLVGAWMCLVRSVTQFRARRVRTSPNLQHPGKKETAKRLLWNWCNLSSNGIFSIIYGQIDSSNGLWITHYIPLPLINQGWNRSGDWGHVHWQPTWAVVPLLLVSIADVL